MTIKTKGTPNWDNLARTWVEILARKQGVKVGRVKTERKKEYEQT